MHTNGRPRVGGSVWDAARAVLEPEEELRMLARVRGAWGVAHLEPRADLVRPQQHRETSQVDRVWAFCTRTTLRKVTFSILLAPVLVVIGFQDLIDSLGDFVVARFWYGFRRVVGGVVAKGPCGSLAEQVWNRLEPTSGEAARHMLVGDRRVVLAERNSRTGRFSRVGSVPLPLVDIVAVHRPRRPLRRRVELRFGDGSTVVLAVPLLARPSSRVAELIAALGAGAPQR